MKKTTSILNQRVFGKAGPGLFRSGLSLVEILMALFIMTLAVLPAIGAFSGYYGVATRQMEQEIALKLGEAVVNVLLTTNYTELVKGNLTGLPLNIQTPSGNFAGNLNFENGMATSTAVEIGRASYKISAAVKKVFIAQDIFTPHTDALEFSWLPADAPPPPPGPPMPAAIATYSCRDDLICIKVSVDYGGARPFELATFRADMAQ
ncbi:MAG: hypothetical protein PHD82_05370 [Candidatus Riflebacteria bacterium]|jgi:hypothetical protein|nr:hypothetical protein [Candidatus Riflebacteria bacterium]